MPLACPLNRCSSVKHRVVRARTEIRAEHGIQRERALQQRSVEGLFEHVEDIDAGDAQELAHRIAAEQADIQAQHRGGHRVRTAAAGDARRTAVVLLAEHAREFQHLRVIVGERRAVLLRQRDPRRACRH